MRYDFKALTIELQAALEQAIESGDEAGCQLAIYWNGQLQVDIAAGEGIGTRSLFPIFSCGKSVMATTFHRLVERSLVSYETLVGDIWPEYACNGKENTLVWHVLTHRAGMAALPQLDSTEQMVDWDLMCAKLAAGKPSWEPGGRFQYHGITFAWLVGELVRRITGKPFRQVMIDEVIKPLGLEDELIFGTEREYVRIDASAVPPQKRWCDDFIGNDVIRQGFIPSANGLATAHALAKYYAAIMGKIGGIRLLGDKTIAEATQLRRAIDDPVSDNEWSKFGLGYVLCGPAPDYGRIFGQGGAAGAEGFADKATGLCVGFTRNKLHPLEPDYPVRNRISEILGLPKRVW
ncbi:MAG: serine hydrolase domain-containing protein [Lentisphaeria bacterium]|jgi:CubicO group peptidase (beta-lactamase class C family)|nr:beta-lactamase family protein [Lentisphaerota bacterium]